MRPNEVADGAAADPHAALQRWLGYLWPMFAAAAAVQLFRYLLLVANRRWPIPAWLDLTSAVFTVIGGVLAALGALVALVLFARWVVAVRRLSYRSVDRTDPRRGAMVVLAAAVPFVNVVTAPHLLYEAAHAVGGVRAAQARRIIDRAAVAWALLSLAGLIALIYRIVVAWPPNPSESIQTGADAMVWAIVTFVGSALFSRWLRPRLPRAVAFGRDEEAVVRRLVVA